MTDMTVVPLDVLAGQHLSLQARRGSLLQYADMCRSDAAAATSPIDADELYREAIAAECRALEIEAEAA